MSNDIKSGVGYIIPAAGVVGFFITIVMEETLASIVIAIAGILVWFLYMLVMEAHMPKQMGNMIILFGIMLSLGIFLGFGVDQHLHGGFMLQIEGLVFSLVILFFAVLTGLNFRNQQTSLVTSKIGGGGLSDDDRKLVMNAINKAQSSGKDNVNEEPKIIVVKQDDHTVNKKNNVQQLPSSQTPYDPYLMTNNPYFSYPPDYYYGDDDDDEYEYEDDWDDYDYEEDED